MKILIVFNREPYDNTDVTWNGLRLAGKLQEAGQEVRIFLMNDSVDMARDVCKPPENYDQDLSAMLKNLIAKGVPVKVCGTCMARCGIYKILSDTNNKVCSMSCFYFETLSKALPGLWGDFSLNGQRVHVEAAKVKEDVCFEPLAIAVAAGLLHEQLDAAVDPFGQSVAKAVLEDAHDTGEAGLECAGHLLDGFQLRSDGGRIPLQEEVGGVGDIKASLERAPQFFEAPGASGLQS